MAKRTLSAEVRVFIVQSLACFDTPSVAVEAVRKEFGVEVKRQVVEGYDPTKRAGRNLSPTWKELFETTRAAFLDDTSGIAISHRAVRLRALQRMAVRAEEAKNLALAASLYEQAAKEVGDAYTNRREHTGKGGTPLVPEMPPADGNLSLALLNTIMNALNHSKG